MVSNLVICQEQNEMIFQKKGNLNKHTVKIECMFGIAYIINLPYLRSRVDF